MSDQDQGSWLKSHGTHAVTALITAVITVAVTTPLTERFKTHESLRQAAVLDTRKALGEVWQSMAAFERAMQELPELKCDEARARMMEKVLPTGLAERQSLGAEIARQDAFRLAEMRKIQSAVAAHRHVIGDDMTDYFDLYIRLVVGKSNALADSYDPAGGEYAAKISKDAAEAYDKQLKSMRFVSSHAQPG